MLFKEIVDLKQTLGFRTGTGLFDHCLPIFHGGHGRRIIALAGSVQQCVEGGIEAGRSDNPQAGPASPGQAPRRITAVPA